MEKAVHLLLSVLIALFLFGCGGKGSQNKELPILGIPRIEVNGASVDTIYHHIEDFQFLNQNQDTISEEKVKGKIFVADFFFTSCPTICPQMKKQLMRVYEKYAVNDQFLILSHTIDPKYDTPEVLNDYAEKLGVSAKTWHFLTGQPMNEVYRHAKNSYMVVAEQDEKAAGGFAHGGQFLLVDSELRIRGVYDGTLAEQVDVLMEDIELLLGQLKSKS